jgi:hypothetical protein
MARPTTLTLEQQARIAGSSLPPAVLLAQLRAEGWAGSLRTVQRARSRAKAGDAGGAKVRPGDLLASLQARGKPAPAPPPAELAPDDDLGRLARRRDEIDQALGLWQPQLGANGAAVRAYRALSAELASLTRTLVELRPRPEVEAERLEALGGAARDRILARAVAAADADETHALRERIVEQERAIELLRGALAEG